MLDADREKWILAKQMSAAVMCLNAPFCEGGPAERTDWQTDVATKIAEGTTKMALEDALAVLGGALIILQKGK